MFFGQLVCRGCHKILTYPFTAISCACRNCGTVNAAHYLRVRCPCCDQSILLPINTLTFLCPVCATVTDIPEDMLPPIEEPVDLDCVDRQGRGDGRGGYGEMRTIYVAHPSARHTRSNAEAADGGAGSAPHPDPREERRAALQRARQNERNLRAQLLSQTRAGPPQPAAPQISNESDSTVSFPRGVWTDSLPRWQPLHSTPSGLMGGESTSRQSNRVPWVSRAIQDDEQSDDVVVEDDLTALDMEPRATGASAGSYGVGGRGVRVLSREEREGQEQHPQRSPEDPRDGYGGSRDAVPTADERSAARLRRERERAARATVLVATRIL